MFIDQKNYGYKFNNILWPYSGRLGKLLQNKLIGM